MQQKGKQNQSRSKLSDKDQATPKILKRPERRGCQACEELLAEGKQLLTDDDIKEGYEKLVEIMAIDHRSDKHHGLVQKAIGLIVTKLGDAAVPGKFLWRHKCWGLQELTEIFIEIKIMSHFKEFFSFLSISEEGQGRVRK